MFIRHLVTCTALALAVSVTACGTSAPIDAATDAPSPDAAPSPTSDAGRPVCDKFGTTCTVELDTACDNDAICHCGVWMKSEEAKKIVCGTPTRDAGVIESSVTDSGMAEVSADAAETGAADSDVSAETSLPDTSPVDSGTDSGMVADTLIVADTIGPAVGTLVVSATVPRWGSSHSITLYGWSVPAKWTATGRSIVISASVAEGSKFVFNGFFDPKTTSDDWTNAFCDEKTMSPRVALWASFNGKPTARVTVVSNSSGGCNLEFIAAPSPFISTTDKDGDGFSPTDPDPAKRDCDDDPVAGNRRFPWQVETPEDSVDLNCDGWNDPPRAVIRLKGVSYGASPLVYDVLRWGTTIAMTWDSASGSYQTPPLEMEIAPRVFFIHWPVSGWDSSYESSICKELTGGVLMYRDTDKTLIPVTLKVSSLGTSCHRFSDF